MEREMNMSKQSVPLARALKIKNRLAGRLAQLRMLISTNNSRDEDNPRICDVRLVLDEASKLKQRLVEVKTAIANANQGIVQTIIELEETKGELAWLRELDTNCCSKREWKLTREIVVNVTAVIGGQERLQMEKVLQKKAEELQDQLDEYNACHYVGIEVDD